MKKSIIIAILFSNYITVQAQSINLEFPYFAGQTYDFTIFQGDKRITLKQDTIPKGGKVQLTIPESHSGYKGMAQWYLTNSATGGGLDLIINNENFSVTCLDSIPTDNTIVYKNTDENIIDKANYKKQQDLFQKHDAMLASKLAFPPKSKFYKSAAKEYNNIIKQYAAYANHLNQSHLYAAKFRQIVNLTMGIGTIITLDENEKANNINNFITNELDFAILYTSNHWGGIINNWIQLQTIVVKDDAKLIAEATIILNRIKDDKVYTDFVINLTTELTRTGKDDVLFALIGPIKTAKRLLNYEGVLSIYKQDLSGKAPDLVVTEHVGKVEDHNHKTTVLKSSELAMKGYTKTVVIFYQSGCGPCEELMQQLPQKYEVMKNKHIRLITISADESEQVFKNASRDYAWPDKYCDFEGKKGSNFKNYAVIATPTIFVIDREGNIVSKHAKLEEITELNK